MNLRCLVLGHAYQFGIMPAYEGVVTRCCRRCHKLSLHLAEAAEDQLARIEIARLFRRGWPW